MSILRSWRGHAAAALTAVMAARSAVASEYRYEEATVTLKSGLAIKVRDLYVKNRCEQSSEQPGGAPPTGEVTEIIYWSRGASATGVDPTILHLHDEGSIFLRRVSFDSDGSIERVEFSNRPTLDAKDYEIEFSSDGRGLGCIVFAGTSIAQNTSLPSGKTLPLPEIPGEVFWPVQQVRQVAFEHPRKLP